MNIAFYYPNLFSSLFAKHIWEQDLGKFTHGYITKDSDFVYSASLSALPQAHAAAMAYEKPLVCWVWDLPVNWQDWCRTPEEIADNAWRTGDIKRKLELLKDCRLVISASKFTQNVLTSYGIKSEQLYFYINVPELNAVKLQDINLISTRKNIIQISRFAINKRFELSLLAGSKLQDCSLTLIGTGNDSKLRSTAKGLNVNCNIVKNVPRGATLYYLYNSDLLVSPSVFEGWGITPIEALYLGVPVVLSELEVFREVWGDIPVYHKIDDADDMAEKIKYVLDNPLVGKTMVEKAKPIIAEFTPEKFAERWMRVIEERVL